MSSVDDDDSTVAGGVTSGFRQHLNRQLGYHGNGDLADDPDSPSKGQSAYYQSEISRLRDALQTTATGPLEAKFLEQVKKNRELLVKLESERAKVSKLTARVVVLEKEKVDAAESSQMARGINLPSQRTGAGTNHSSLGRIGAMEPVPEESVEERLEKANRIIAVQRKALEELKRDNAKIRRVLQVEIGGDEDAVELALRSMGDTAASAPSSTGGGGGAPAPPPGGWKGRAQQISLLKGRVKDLEKQLRQCSGQAVGAVDDTTSVVEQSETMTQRTAMTVKTSATSVKDFDDVNRSVVEVKQRKIQAQARDVLVKLEERERELDEERRRSESTVARLQILERDNQHLKNCLQRIVEKTENDDRLIAAYKAELEEKKIEMRRAATAGSLTRAGGHDMQRIDALERENARLHEALSDLRSRPGVRDGQAPPQAWVSGSPDAVELVEAQRRTILALEAQLEKRDRVTSAQFDTVKGCDAVLRDENAALKFRIKAVTEMMDREIALHEAMAAEKVAAASVTAHALKSATRGAAAAAADGRDRENASGEFGESPSTCALPPISRPTSNASSTRRGSKPLAEAPVSTSSGVRQEEFDHLKRQYDELKRAFNSHQSKSLK